MTGTWSSSSLRPRNVDIMKEYWSTMVEQARLGNVEAAQDVLRDFAEAVEQVRLFKEPEKAWSGPIPWPLADYLAISFRAILDAGSDPGHALNLIGKTRGRQKGKVTTHDLEALAASFNLLIRNGFKPEEANTALGEALGADRATIYRAREEFEAFKYPKMVDDEILKVSLKPYVAQVSAILKSRKK